MGLVQYLLMVLMFPAHLVLASPLTTTARTHEVDGRRCQRCPAGKYRKYCAQCWPCPAGSFTSDWNVEDSCERCSGDCRADYHLKVAVNCTSTSDTKCVCEAGFTCVDKVRYSDNCRSCVRIQPTDTTTAAAAAAPPPPPPTHVASGNKGMLPLPFFSGNSTASNKVPPLSKPGFQSNPPTPREGLTPVSSASATTSWTLAAILCPVVLVGLAAAVILSCVRRPGDDTCFKRAVANIRDGGRRASASYKSKDSSHRFSKDSLRPKQQPAPLAAANIGPVHVHNPGTVILSLLSQFTGHVGGTAQGEKAAHRADNEETYDGESPVCHPTPSHGVPLSEEEGGGGGGGGGGADQDNVFFPSQEEGKDSHVSKEEEDGL